MAVKLPIPPHRARLPDPGGHFRTLPKEDREYMLELVAALQREHDKTIKEHTARHEIPMFLPDGSVWAFYLDYGGPFGPDTPFAQFRQLYASPDAPTGPP